MRDFAGGCIRGGDPFVQLMDRGPVGLGSAPTGSTHIVRARVLLDLDGP
jgi:hypothetical protein